MDPGASLLYGFTGTLLSLAQLHQERRIVQLKDSRDSCDGVDGADGHILVKVAALEADLFSPSLGRDEARVKSHCTSISSRKLLS